MRKLMWFAIGFAVAMLIGTYILPVQFYLAAAGAAALLLAVFLVCMLHFPKMGIAAMAVFSCVVGFMWLFAFDSLYLSTARAYDDVEMELTIVASDYSYETDYGAATEGKIELNGKAYTVLAYHDKDSILAPGDTIIGNFLLRSTLPGGRHESEYNRSNNIFLTARPRGDLSVCRSEQIPLKYYPAFIRHRIIETIQSTFPADTAAFACALLLGETDGIDYETDTAFKLSGIRHIIAVSGLHVTILFSLVYVVTGRRKWITALLGIPVLFIFAAVAGFSPSITRACIMHSLMVIAMLFNKEYDPPSALSFAVVCMLSINPWSVTNVGFQLSVCCLIGIIMFSERIKNYLMDKKRLGRCKGIRKKLAAWLASSVSISLSAVVFTTPLCAYYFGVVSIIGPLTNLLTLWIITFVFYGIMLACLMGLVLPIAGTAIAWLISWPIRYVLWVAKLMASLPLSAVYTHSIYIVVWLVFVYVLLGVFLLAKNKYPIHLTCFATIGLCFALIASWTEPMKDDFRVTVLDVGQGQCILLQSEGRNYLVDCGSYSESYAADQAAGMLLSQGIIRLDGVILTHFDSDHAGGVAYLLTRVPADYLFLPNCPDEDETSQALYAYTEGAVQNVLKDMVVSFGNTKISIIPSKSASSNNESGLAILFQTKNCDILITGDRSEKGELELIEHMTLPELEVLIVGHHGSKTSTCRELLIKTSPEIAIISVAADNSYGHPADEVLQRLEKFGCKIYRTDLSGTIIYRG